MSDFVVTSGRNTSPYPTPDGKWVVSFSIRDGKRFIWRIPVEGGEPKHLEGISAERTFSYGWSRDGKQFAFGRVRDVCDAVLISDFR